MIDSGETQYNECKNPELAARHWAALKRAEWEQRQSIMWPESWQSMVYQWRCGQLREDKLYRRSLTVFRASVNR